MSGKSFEIIPLFFETYLHRIGCWCTRCPEYFETADVLDRTKDRVCGFLQNTIEIVSKSARSRDPPPLALCLSLDRGTTLFLSWKFHAQFRIENSVMKTLRNKHEKNKKKQTTQARKRPSSPSRCSPRCSRSSSCSPCSSPPKNTHARTAPTCALHFSNWGVDFCVRVRKARPLSLSPLEAFLTTSLGYIYISLGSARGRLSGFSLFLKPVLL